MYTTIRNNIIMPIILYIKIWRNNESELQNLQLDTQVERKSDQDSFKFACKDLCSWNEQFLWEIEFQWLKKEITQQKLDKKLVATLAQTKWARNVTNKIKTTLLTLLLVWFECEWGMNILSNLCWVTSSKKLK